MLGMTDEEYAERESLLDPKSLIDPGEPEQEYIDPWQSEPEPGEFKKAVAQDEYAATLPSQLNPLYEAQQFEAGARQMASSVLTTARFGREQVKQFDLSEGLLKFEKTLTVNEKPLYLRARAEIYGDGSQGYDREQAAHIAAENIILRRREINAEIAGVLRAGEDYMMSDRVKTLLRDPRLGSKVVQASGGSIANVGLTAVSPKLGAASMFSWMKGSMIKDLEARGVDPETIAKVSTISAAVSLPLEFFGNLMQLQGIVGKFGGTNLISKFVRRLFVAGPPEGVTEGAQAVPEGVALFYAMNKDLPRHEFAKKLQWEIPKIVESVKENTLVGTLSGGAQTAVTGGGLDLFLSVADKFKTSGQRVHDNHTKRATQMLVDKVEGGVASEAELAKLKEMAQALGDEQDIEELDIAAIRGKVIAGYGLHDTIKHETRTAARETLEKRFGPKTAHDAVVIMDGIARRYAEDNDKPQEAWYDDYLGKVTETELEKFLEDQAREVRPKAEPPPGLVITDEDQDTEVSEVVEPMDLTFTPVTPEAAGPAAEGLVQDQEVRTYTTGNILAEGNVAKSAVDVAGLMASIRKSSQELAYAVAVDGQGRVLEIHRYSKGTAGATPVRATEMVGHAFNIEGVKKLYFVHNHPGGGTKPSPGDRAAVTRLEKLAGLKGLPVENLIVGGTQFARFNGNQYSAPREISPKLRKVRLPVKERRTFGDAKVRKTLALNSPDNARRSIAEMGGGDGVLLMSSTLKRVGWLPLKYGTPRREMSAKIIAAIEATNATDIIFNSSRPLFDTVSPKAASRRRYLGALRDVLSSDVRVRDVLDPSGSARLSGKTIGQNPWGDIKKVPSHFDYEEVASEEKLFQQQLQKLDPALSGGLEKGPQGSLTFHPVKAALGYKKEPLFQGVSKPVPSGRGKGKFLRGDVRSAGNVDVVVDALEEKAVLNAWDQSRTLKEARDRANSFQWLDPTVVHGDEDFAGQPGFAKLKSGVRKKLRWGRKKETDDKGVIGLYGNSKMAWPNFAYPMGRNTWDIPGCGREAWAVLNSVDITQACYGGACYAEQLTKAKQGLAAGVASGVRVSPMKDNALRAKMNAFYKKNGLEATRKKWSEYQLKVNETKGSKNFGKLSIGEVTSALPAAVVTTRLQPAKGADIRLGVDTDGSAWLSDPKVMDAILKADPRTLTVYSSAYHKPPPAHPLAGRTIINVTVSGWHPLPETLSRIRWAEQARFNGWNVILREVVANPMQFGEDTAVQYNRLHDALLKTDFFIMQQPLHIGGTHGEPMWKLPSCCVGSERRQHTCDQCEVSEGLGPKFQEYWGIHEERDRKSEIVMPDSDYEGRVLFQTAAWHGGPHVVKPRFSTDYIGTGEGNQSFGWGLYFTEMKAIARHYAKKLSSKYGISIQGTPVRHISDLRRHFPDLYKHVGWSEVVLAAEGNDYNTVEGLREMSGVLDSEEAIAAWNRLADIIEAGELKMGGHRNLYKVSLHEGKAPSDYSWLDWRERPTEEAVNKINALARKKLAEVGVDIADDNLSPEAEAYANIIVETDISDISIKDAPKLYDGQMLYRNLLQQELGDPKAASMFLLEAGIDGIRYPAMALSGRPSKDKSNFVVFDDEAVTIEEHIQFQQDKEEKPRGAVEYMADRTKRIVHLFETADESTIIHELGHTLLDMLYASKDSDYNRAAEWVGVESDRRKLGLDAWTVDEKERFARGFEAYILEGRAPTLRMQGVFHRLRKLLVDIYKSVKALNVELDENIIGVFDRLVSTEAERESDPAYEVLDYLRVDDVIGADAERAALEADDDWQEIIAEAARRATEEKRAEFQKRDKKVRAELRKTAQKLVEEDPVHALRTQIREQGGIDPESIRFTHGDTYVADIQKKRPGLLSKNGLPADVYATEAGYDTDQMIEMLLHAPTKAQAIENAYVDLVSEWEIQQDYELAETYEDVINSEIDIIHEILGKPHVMPDAKKTIREQTGQVSDAEYKELTAHIKKLSKDARETWNAGRKELRAQLEKTAAQEKAAIRDQYKAAMADRILKIENEKKALVARLKHRHKTTRRRREMTARVNRAMRSKSIHGQFRQQIAAIARRFNFKIPREIDAPPAVGLAGFALQIRNEMGDYVADVLDDEIARLEREIPADVPRGKLSLEQIESINDIVTLIATLGRQATETSKILGDQEYQQLIGRLVDQIETVWGPVKSESDMAKMRKLRTKLRRLADSRKRAQADRLKAEFLFRAADGWQDDGPNQKLFQAIARAENEETALGGQMFREMQAAFAGFGGKKWSQEKFPVLSEQLEGWDPEEPITKEEMIMIALNSGNDGNRHALRQISNGEKNLTDDDIDAVVNALSTEERQLVEDIWTLIDKMYPMLNAVHMKITGLTLPKVEGRYFPLVFDPKLSDAAAANEERAQQKDLFHNSPYLKRYVEAGSRKVRVGSGTNRPLLSFDVITGHIVRNVHDITHQIPVRDVNKVINTESYKRAFKSALGEHKFRQLQPWLNNIAKPDRMPRIETEKFLRRLLPKITVVSLGGKVSVMLAQWPSILQTVKELGMPENKKHTSGGIASAEVIKAMTEVYAHPKRSAEFIYSKSIEVATRSKNFDRELQMMYESLRPDGRPLAEKAKDALFGGIQFMDKMATLPSWLAAYNVGLSKFDGDDVKAVEFADSIVRRTQPASRPKDLAAVMRSDGWQRLFTPFYTFFSVMHNQVVETNLRLKAGNITIAQAMRAYWWLLLVPPIIGDMMRKLDTPDEPMDVVKSIGGFYFAQFPLLRHVASAVITGYDFSLSPLDRVGTDIARLSTIRSYNLNKGQWKAAIRTLGYTSGMIPADQVNTIIDGVDNYFYGDEKNPVRILVRGNYK